MPQVSLPSVASPAPAASSPSGEARAAAKTSSPRSPPGRLRPEAPVFSFSPLGTARTDPMMPAVHGRADLGLRPSRDSTAGPGPVVSDGAPPPSPLAHEVSLADRINLPPPVAVPPPVAAPPGTLPQPGAAPPGTLPQPGVEPPPVASPQPKAQPQPSGTAPPAGAVSAIACANCDAENPPGYRFCVTCGAPLQKRSAGSPVLAPPPAVASRGEPAASLAAATTGAPQPMQRPAPDGAARPAAIAVPPRDARPSDGRPSDGAAPQIANDGAAPLASRGDGPEGRGEQAPPPPVALPPPRVPLPPGGGTDKIVGSPVLDIAASRQAPARQIECARCHGQCVAGTRFCKYCGAPLEGERAAHEPSSPAERHSPAPAPEIARDAPRPPPDDGAAQAGSTEPIGGAPPPSQIPLAPLRVSYSVRPPAWVPADARPARAPEGKLIVIVEDGTEGKSFPLTGQQVDIGRTEGDILLEDDLYVSPRHARLIPQNGTWVLRDLGSINRIYLRIRKAHPLRDGDLLLLGLEVLQFQTVSDGERGLGHAIQHGTLLFGSPAIHRRARLCQRTVEGVTRDVYHLYRDETVIGRETGDIVFTADPFLSRRHAAIRRNPASGSFTLTDLDSSNGTYVAIREDVPLADRDFVRIGQHLFRVDLS